MKQNTRLDKANCEETGYRVHDQATLDEATKPNSQQGVEASHMAADARVRHLTCVRLLHCSAII